MTFMYPVAIPVKDGGGLDSPVNEHFSRSPFFVVLDDKGNMPRLVENKSAFTPGHEGTMELLKANGVRQVLCSGIGPGALDYAQELGITVCFGRAKSARELLGLYMDGKLENVSDGSPCAP